MNYDGLYEIYDRFSFDELFKSLLREGLDYEDALNFILCNCALSALVFQERIYNKFYLNLVPEPGLYTKITLKLRKGQREE
ncbi:MAG: hypothetical protein DRG83_04265 [Deltaproteobacteria bacterium]|nr:MAG: hypothetical protein DRG83_04265 [Deltaproteobacteria bacterium]